jgi:hypothetical protein
MTMNETISFIRFYFLGFGAPLTVENDLAFVPGEDIEELEPFEGHVKPYLHIFVVKSKSS